MSKFRILYITSAVEASSHRPMILSWLICQIQTTKTRLKRVRPILATKPWDCVTTSAREISSMPFFWAQEASFWGRLVQLIC